MMTNVNGKYLNEFPALKNQLEKNGFIKHPVFPAALLNQLYNAVMDEMKEDKVSFYYSGQDSSVERKKYFYKLVLSSFSEYIEKIFPEYTISRIIVVLKGIGENSSCKLHTDDNSFNESNGFPVNIWTPLVDTGNFNGGLNVVPESHQYASKIRGFNIPQYYMPYHEELLKRSTGLNTQLGESVIYHPGILHFSNNNTSQNLRPAIVIGLAPKKEKQIVYFGVKNWLGLKVYTMNIPLMDYLNWDEKSILESKIENIQRFRHFNIDKNTYAVFLKNR